MVPNDGQVPVLHGGHPELFKQAVKKTGKVAIMDVTCLLIIIIYNGTKCEI